MSKQNYSYYHSYILCEGPGAITTSNCKFLTDNSPVYKKSYCQYIPEYVSESGVTDSEKKMINFCINK